MVAWDTRPALEVHARRPIRAGISVRVQVKGCCPFWESEQLTVPRLPCSNRSKAVLRVGSCAAPAELAIFGTCGYIVEYHNVGRRDFAALRLVEINVLDLIRNCVITL
jgi:hypothetical protein